MPKRRRLHLKCPDCAAELVVDAATGEILSHKKVEAPIAGGRDIDDLMQEMKAGKRQAEDVFRQEVAAIKDRDRLLDEKFEEALKRARDEPEDEPPPSPFDFD